MLMEAPRFREATNPLDPEARRACRRHARGLPRGPRERHWLIAAVAVAVVASTVSAYAAYQQGQTQKAIGKYNAKVAENAAIAQRQAAAIAAENERDKARLIMGAQRAGIGAAGVLPSEGTPLLVQTDTAEKAALNEARIRYSGEVGARVQEAEAIIQGYTARRAEQMGYVNAGANLLQGASSALGAYGLRSARTSGGSTGSAGYSSGETVSYGRNRGYYMP